MLLIFAIPSLIDSIRFVPDLIVNLRPPVDSNFLLPTVLLLFTVSAWWWLTIHFGRLAFRFIVSMFHIGRERGFALLGIAMTALSFTLLYLPSFFVEDLVRTTATFNFSVVWIPAAALVLVGLGAFSQARWYAWYSLCLVPIIPLVVVSLHENIWYPHSRACPAFWLSMFQSPWVALGLSFTYIEAVAIAMHAGLKTGIRSRTSAIRLLSIIAVAVGIEVLGVILISPGWLIIRFGIFVAPAFLAVSIGLIAVVDRWRGGAWNANGPALTALVTLPIALPLACFVFAVYGTITDCWIVRGAVHQLVGRFFW